MLTECRDDRSRLIELARGTAAAEARREVMAHVERCPACARVLDEQLALSAALGAVVDEATPQLPEMAAIEGRVLAEFDRAAARRRATRWIWTAGMAAALLLGMAGMGLLAPHGHPPARVTHDVARAMLPAPETAPIPAATVMRVQHKAVRRASREDSQPFLPIPYTAPLSPGERTVVVRMEIPVAALIAAGFDVPVLDSGAMVEADALVSQDGRVRAIRPVSVSTGK